MAQPIGLAWSHRDNSGDLHAASLQANALALAGGPWPEGAEGNRLFRAWMVGVLATIANLGPDPAHTVTPSEATIGQIGPGGAYVVHPVPSSRAVNLDWQQQLVYGFAAVVWAAQGKSGGDPNALALTVPLAIQTVDGQEPIFAKMPDVILKQASPSQTAELDTGILPAIPIVTGLVIVACVAIVAGAVGWIASQASEVSSVGLQTAGKTTLGVQAMTKATEVIDAHQERERQEGKDIPYDAEQLKMLQTLRETIQSTAGWAPPALRSVPDVRGAVDKIGTGLSIGAALFWALLGWAAIEYAKRR